MSVTGIFIERHPSYEGELPELRLLTPVADGLATQIGNILVGWGGLLDSLKGYTRNLISFNGTTNDMPRRPEAIKLIRKFEEEVEVAFGQCPTAKILSDDIIKKMRLHYALRNHLAHDLLSWGTSGQGEPLVIIHYRSPNGNEKLKRLNLAKLQAAAHDIDVARGRLFQLALRNQLPMPYTSSERSTLQAIAAKGYLNLPKPDKTPSPLRS